MLQVTEIKYFFNVFQVKKIRKSVPIMTQVAPLLTMLGWPNGKYQDHTEGVEINQNKKGDDYE